MRQEGRGIGLHNKIKAYSLQDNGLDTVEANKTLGFDADMRHYEAGAQILLDLGVSKLRLLTNNPGKVVGLSGFGLEIQDRIPLEVAGQRREPQLPHNQKATNGTPAGKLLDPTGQSRHQKERSN